MAYDDVSPMEWDYGRDSHTWHNINDLERWSSLAAGAALLAYAFGGRRSGAAAYIAATPLIQRGLMGHCYVYEALGVSTAEQSAGRSGTQQALSGQRGVHVRDAVRIAKPVEDIYRFWRQLENLPRFMNYLERVVDLGGGRSHWVAKGPADVPVEWDAEIINEVENKVIGWRSLEGSDVTTAGSVSFEPARDGSSTQVSVNLQYSVPGGKAGSAIAWLAGREPSQTVREDLRRLKQILEAGEIPTASRSYQSQEGSRTASGPIGFQDQTIGGRQ